MLNWIVGSSLKFRYIVMAVAIGMMYFGYAQLREMPVDVLESSQGVEDSGVLSSLGRREDVGQSFGVVFGVIENRC